MEATLDRRAELLSRIVDELLTRGAADLSLRPLAERVGTSARLLMYHFGSKEQLVAAALAEVRRHIGASLYARAARSRPQTLRDLMTMVWDWATEPPNQRYFRLLFEVDGLAMFDRLSFSEEVRRANGAVWISLIDRAAGRLAQGGDLFLANSTLILGAFTGLLQDFLSTGDRARTTQALAALVDLISEGRALPAPMEGGRS
ncbi:TetR/AcrR family transcriptional regulator [Phenylobacterium sp.]|uniref:TetR/AcrR family transcriptional regulator n=1 Tax=Phenylobacterium sp. TaxID=1871053 RepID=UPI001204465B|nr:TetR/AcrR family transcriptional regulator [Phenylobacterium sp.]THD61265.1 MAG: TetR/AcrR family transcriptional regulator [Phenylobacterium sp.]